MDMTILGELFIIYLVLINVISFICFGVDKYKAVRQRWRIPENILLLLAAVGGSAGAIAAMVIFRHKIRKSIFSLGLPVIMIFQALLYFFAKLY